MIADIHRQTCSDLGMKGEVTGDQCIKKDCLKHEDSWCFTSKLLALPLA